MKWVKLLIQVLSGSVGQLSLLAFPLSALELLKWQELTGILLIKNRLNDAYLPFPNQFPTHSTTLGQPELW